MRLSYRRLAPVICGRPDRQCGVKLERQLNQVVIPCRAGRSVTENVSKPVRVTSSPRTSAAAIEINALSIVLPTASLVWSVASAMAAIRSALFMVALSAAGLR